MKLMCTNSRLSGEVAVPSSKSHTIRAVAIASLAAGRSCIHSPLVSQDTLSAVAAYRSLGAEIETGPDTWTILGIAAEPKSPPDIIDVGNSGTTMNVVLGSSALLRQGMAVLTGDEQVRRRPCGPLADALNKLGASVRSTQGGGLPPFVVEGRIRGGFVTLEAVSSQYLTSLLLCAPLADGETEIEVSLLNEPSYVHMTMDWLARQSIEFEHEGLRSFRVKGHQCYKSFDLSVPADFSSATFFLCAGALNDNDITVRGLDMNDPQGDKAVVDYLRQLGARVDVEQDHIRVRPGDLKGVTLDINNTPDALPMLAVLGCFAKGKTALTNVAQARAKETDRIKVMCKELRRLGAKVEELPDGLVIEQSRLRAAEVHGHGDHRVVMALTVAGLSIGGNTFVDTAESVAVTFPTFIEKMSSLGASLQTE